MRVVSKTRLRDFWDEHPDSERELTQWHRITKAASWRNPTDVKQSFGVRVDFVKVRSGNTVAVFDILNNKYRLIAAIHYDYPRVFVLRVMTHKAYDRDKWKEQL